MADVADVKLSNGQTLSAKLAIGAFGLTPHLFAQFGVPIPEFSLGLQAEIVLPPTEIDDTIEFFFDPKYSKSGYSWVFPKKDHIAIGLVAAPEKSQKTDALYNFISDYTTLHPTLKQHLPSQPSDLKLQGAMLPNTPIEQTYGNRFMLLGDAAGLIDPTTWEGIYFAFKSADLALSVFEENYGKTNFSAEALGKYQQRWKTLFGTELDHARSIQQRVYGERMGKLWTLIIHELNRDAGLKRLVTDELSTDMSIANMVEKIPFTTKLRLIAKYSREPHK